MRMDDSQAIMSCLSLRQNRNKTGLRTRYIRASDSVVDRIHRPGSDSLDPRSG